MDQENSTTPEQNTQAPQTTPAPASTPTPAADNTMVMGILAYIGILVLIPLLTAKDQPGVKFHIRQGLVLLVAELAVWVIGEMVYGYMIHSVLGFVNLGLLVLSIVGIVNVVQKKEVELPLLGQFAKHFTI